MKKASATELRAIVQDFKQNKAELTTLKNRFIAIEKDFISVFKNDLKTRAEMTKEKKGKKTSREDPETLLQTTKAFAKTCQLLNAHTSDLMSNLYYEEVQAAIEFMTKTEKSEDTITESMNHSQPTSIYEGDHNLPEQELATLLKNLNLERSKNQQPPAS